MDQAEETESNNALGVTGSPKPDHEGEADQDSIKERIEDLAMEVKLLKQTVCENASEMKLECQKLSLQLSGIKNLHKRAEVDEGKSKSLDPTIVREMLEDSTTEIKNLIATQLKRLNPTSDEGNNSSTLPKLQRLENDILPKIDFGEVKASEIDIRASTDDEEQAFLTQEIEDFIQDKQLKLVDGASIKGTNIASISEAISDVFSFSVEIGNYLDVNLSELDHIWEHKMQLQELNLPDMIEAGKREVVTFSSSVEMTGLFSYCIHELNLRIIFGRSGDFISVALAPIGVLIQSNPVYLGGSLSDSWMIRPKRNCVVQNRIIRARVVTAKTGKKLTAQVDLLRHAVKDLSSENGDAGSDSKNKEGGKKSGKEKFWKSSRGRIQRHIWETYGYVVEMVNLLNVSLTDPVCYLEDGHVPKVMPESVPPSGYKRVIVKTKNAGKGNSGMVAFRFGETDLRLAIAFQLFSYGNRFAAVLLPLAFTGKKYELAYLVQDHWKTSSDCVYAKASDGEQVIEARNVRVKLTMTDGMRANLYVAIKTI